MSSLDICIVKNFQCFSLNSLFCRHLGECQPAITYDQTHDKKRKIINSHSVATAKLGMVVLSALGGGASNKAKIADFLPFETPRPATSITSETEEVVRWALRTQKLPPTVVALLAAELKS